MLTMPKIRLLLPTLTLLALCPIACGDDGMAEAGDETGDGDGDGDDGGDGDGDGDEVPANAAELLPWLEAGEYLDFPAESQIHGQTGASPHGDVRVFINETLDASLAADNESHPEGSAAIKEIYGSDGSTLAGWAVSVKTQADSAGGEGWYWYEILNGSVLADGNADPTCNGCHMNTGVDFFSSIYPLQ